MKRNYTGLKKATAFVLALGLTMQFTACGGAEEKNSEVVEITVTPTAEPTEAVTNTPTPTAEPNESSVETNIGGHNENLPDYEQTYMTFEEIEPTTMYANKDGIMFGNPNQFEGKVLTQGAIEKGVEYVVTMKGTYENTEYYGLVGGQNNIYIIKAEDLSDTKPAEPTPTTAPAKTDNSSSGNSGGSNGSSGGSSDNSGNSGANVTYAPDTVGGVIESGAVTVMDDPSDVDNAEYSDEFLELFDGFTTQ